MDKNIEKKLDKIIDNQVVLINLIGGLAYRLTGEVPTILVRENIGNTVGTVRITPSLSNCEWGEAGSNSPCILREHSPKDG